MNAKQALELKQARERTLVDIDDALSKSAKKRKSGELSQLVIAINAMHKLLTRYDAMETPPSIAESTSTQFAACVSRVEELIAASTEA